MSNPLDEFEEYYNKALRFLSYRPRSEKEIRDNLIKKKASELVVQQVLQKLKEQRFLNDKEFVQWWIQQRTEFKPRSLRLIKFELKRKGISSEIIESQISNFKFPISNDLDQAKKLIGKKIRRYQKLPREEVQLKLLRLLASRGFSYDTSKQAIDEVLKKGV